MFDNLSYLSKLESIGIAFKNLEDENYKKTFHYSRLKKGMGLTIGNALRRVLLGHIPGYAIRSISIQGIQHEFNSIPGMKEDVQEFIMNLRKIVFKGSVPSSKAVLQINKSGVVTAKDVKGVNLDIVNKELYICNISSKTSQIFKIEMFIEKKVGIICARDAKDMLIESGSIVCDSFFSPVVHVNFVIDELDSEYENLEISITTNGSVTPEFAFNFALDVLKEQLFKNSAKKIEIEKSNVVMEREVNLIASKLSMKIEDLPDVSNRALNCLHEMGVKYVGDLVKLTEKKLMDKPNFGKNSLSQLKEKLSMIGLKFDMNVKFSSDDIEEKNNHLGNDFVL